MPPSITLVPILAFLLFPFSNLLKTLPNGFAKKPAPSSIVDWIGKFCLWKSFVLSANTAPSPIVKSLLSKPCSPPAKSSAKADDTPLKTGDNLGEIIDVLPLKLGASL